MASIGVRVRPLVAVISGVPLLVEALASAFSGIADVQGIDPSDGAAAGLLEAFDPDALIVEGPGDGVVEEYQVPCVAVDLEGRRVAVIENARWKELDAELSPEAIRNVVVARLFRGSAP